MSGLLCSHHARSNTKFLTVLDYVIPGYRDLRPGRFLYTRQADRFAGLGVTRLCSAPKSQRQRRYLQRMGFTAARGDDAMLCRAAV